MITSFDNYGSALNFVSDIPQNIYLTSKILSLKNGNKYCELFVQIIDKQITAVIVLNANAMYLTIANNYDKNEICLFASYNSNVEQVIGYNIRSVFANFACLQKSMFLINPINEPDCNVTAAVEYKKIYNLLIDCGFELGGYDEFYVERFYACKQKDCKTYALLENDFLLSTASEIEKTDRFVLLSAVATNKSFRNSGAARKVLSFIQKINADMNKSTYVICRNEKARGFYNKIGAQQVGLIDYIYLK